MKEKSVFAVIVHNDGGIITVDSTHQSMLSAERRAGEVNTQTEELFAALGDAQEGLIEETSPEEVEDMISMQGGYATATAVEIKMPVIEGE